MEKSTIDDHSGRLRVLIYTSLFPNSMQPILGNFIMERMRFLLPATKLSVVAPVPYFPRLNLHERWYRFSKIPRTERMAGFELDHPRYLVVPKLGMATHGLSMFLGSLRQVLRTLKRTPCDLIDAHYIYPDGFAAILLGTVLNKPVVVSARGSDINLFPKFKTVRPLIRQVLNRADAVIAVSEPLKDAMVRLGCPAEKITVIGNGVDAEKFQRRPRNEMRQLLGLPSGRRLLLSVGSLTENKGFHILMESVARLRRDWPDVMLAIIGEGSYRPHLERRIRDLGLQETIFLVGAKPHEELCPWYSAADVFCFASASEGWPNVVMEALACGLPVVSTDVAAPIIVSPALGILVERQAGEFQQAIAEALRREWNHETIIAHARSNDWERVAQNVLNVFSTVVARRDPSRFSAISRQVGHLS